MIRFYKKSVPTISVRYIDKVLKNLTLMAEGSGGSRMHDYLSNLKYLRNRNNIPNDIAIVAVNNRVPIAWCLYQAGTAFAMFYVLPEWRNKGVAKRLFKIAASVAKKQGNNIFYVEPWNRISYNFFAKMGVAVSDCCYYRSSFTIKELKK